jgi:hypothetical protein
VLSEEINVSGHDLATAAWCKSSRSNGDGNVCVEVAFVPGAAAVRDSKNPTGGVLIVPAASWQSFRLTARDDI